MQLPHGTPTELVLAAPVAAMPSATPHLALLVPWDLAGDGIALP